MVRRQLPGLRSRQEAPPGCRCRHASPDQIQKVCPRLSYLLLKFAHVVGATVILGTGSCIAFFMLMAHRSGDAGFIARTARLVVLADMIFTASAVILQPVTGFLLMRQTGVTLAESWIALSILLYLVAGAFWLPVIWIQVRLRDLAQAAAQTKAVLPAPYHRLFRIWFLFGFPGFGAVMAIQFLMIAKPVLY
ncbi:MAG TPA: DUF2269 domain-containing protein [Rhizomicrobium sp.]|nr:DUF2269 domain-containing protein [Rhizomicrobium sp.]